MTATFKENAAIIEQARETLVAAQRIKEDPDFVNAMNYMRVQKHRGKIVECPCKENEYTIKVR